MVSDDAHSGAEFDGADFIDTVVADQYWSTRSYVNCAFTDSDLSGLHTQNVTFTGADLRRSVHNGSAFRSCTFTRTSLWHSEFHHSTLMGSVFENCRVRPLILDEVDLTLTSLGRVDLRGVDLTGCRLREANLVEADLRKAVLRDADLSGARTSGLKLDEADLRGARVDAGVWVGASLTGARVEPMQAMAFAGAHGLRVDLAE